MWTSIAVASALELGVGAREVPTRAGWVDGPVVSVGLPLGEGGLVVEGVGAVSIARQPDATSRLLSQLMTIPERDLDEQLSLGVRVGVPLWRLGAEGITPGLSLLAGLEGRWVQELYVDPGSGVSWPSGRGLPSGGPTAGLAPAAGNQGMHLRLVAQDRVWWRLGDAVHGEADRWAHDPTLELALVARVGGAR